MRYVTHVTEKWRWYFKYNYLIYEDARDFHYNPELYILYRNASGVVGIKSNVCDSQRRLFVQNSCICRCNCVVTSPNRFSIVYLKRDAGSSRSSSIDETSCRLIQRSIHLQIV